MKPTDINPDNYIQWISAVNKKRTTLKTTIGKMKKAKEFKSTKNKKNVAW